MRYLITTLAEYQTAFWVKVGLELRANGHEAGFISFDDRSTEMLKVAGLTVFPATDRPSRGEASGPAFDDALRRFGITDLNFWFGHERFAFDLRDSVELRCKLLGALSAADQACRSFGSDGSFTVIQELGGFLSVVGTYFAARHHGVDNWFVEPAFFRGRLFLLRNSFAALPISEPAVGPVPAAVTAYLEDTVSRGAIVVPAKDRHQYTTAWKKIVNMRNARRLVQKLADKYLRGKRQEFGYIGTHVATHARMLRSSFQLRHHYTPLPGVGPFVYYPLHVPGDMALTLRTPHLLDQLALVDYICRSVPHTHRVVIKEHPAMVGAIDAQRVLDLLRRHDNLMLLPPSTNNYQVLAAAAAVVSVNSKSGAEAALVGKPVIVVGDAFYRGSPLVMAVDRLQDLPAALAGNLAPDRVSPSRDQVLAYFAAVWARCVPGELYVTDDASVRTFSASVVHAVGQPQA